MQPNIGIQEQHRSTIASELSKLVADEYILYTKTRNAHWNVVGPDFSTMHAFFESQYDQLNEIIDEVAERVRALGYRSPGSLQEFLDLTQLSES
ncbi:MAG: ferritin-like domain-containing protein, partial [Bacteroidota bacterium]